MKVFVFAVIVLLSVENIFADCVVNTTLGLVFGGEIEVESGEIVKAFRGIPYAEPPLGNLRFQDPEPKKPWKGVLNTDKKSCQCKQIVNGEIVGSEDCLYLDVYTPKDKDPNASYAVIVYLHDSYSNCLVSGPEYLLDNRKMVYVCVSYRLSVFGYLSTGEVSAPGNFGLKDQLLALKWVQNNIGAFNGDKNDVTIFGQGSGGESVHLQAISLKSENLFKSIICLSGIALVPRAFADDESYYQNSQKLGQRLKCPINQSTKDLVDCLRKADADVLIKESYAIFNEIDVAISTTWRPTKEPDYPGAIFNDTPVNIIKKQIGKLYPVIISHVKDEGTFFTKNLLKDEKLYDLCIKQPVGVIEVILSHYSPLKGKNITDIAVKAKNYYLGVVLPKEKAIVIEGYTNLLSDLYYNFPTIQLDNHLHKVNNNSVYVSRYNYHGTITATLDFGDTSLGVAGVGQGSDLFSIFPLSPKALGPEYGNLKPSKNDKYISTVYIDLGSSFSYNSTPVSSLLPDPHVWKPQNDNPGVYLDIGDVASTKVTLESKYSCSVNFWFDNVPQYSLD